MNEIKHRLFIKVNRDILPRISDRFPFLYLEHGRLEIDDSSVKWLDSEGFSVRIPIATILCIILGPGTSITHDAIRTIASTNCNICWTSENSFIFYAASYTPTATTSNLKRQIELSSNQLLALEVAKAMFKYRFGDKDIENKNLEQLKGMEGLRVRKLYEDFAKKYNLGWRGRKYKPGQFEFSDITNQILTSVNSYLYGIITSIIHGLGYDPRIGFIHKSCPLPFVYDIADLYKKSMAIDTAFYLTKMLAGQYNKDAIREEVKKRAIEYNLLESIIEDIDNLIGEKSDRYYRKQIARCS